MKRLLIILTISLFAGLGLSAQDDDNNDRIRDKMKEFIQRRLGLSKREAARFTPVFLRYFKEWRETVRVHRDDMLLRQQKVAELRIRYRNEFREIVGERKSNEIYKQQEVFIDELRRINRERLETRQRPTGGMRNLLE